MGGWGRSSQVSFPLAKHPFRLLVKSDSKFGIGQLEQVVLIFDMPMRRNHEAKRARPLVVDAITILSD